MKRGGWLYAGLLALALAAGLAGPSSAPDSPVPSVSNPGPRGLALLARWLTQTGHDVRSLQGPPGPEVKTWVIAAPLGHALSPAEVTAVETFVRGGGTLVYLRARRSKVQHDLDAWLKVSSGPALPRDVAKATTDDLLAVSEPVTLRAGPLANVATLRVLADDSIDVDRPDAVPLTKGRVLWWWPLERGEIFVGAGPDLAEAGRLELEGNAAFWAALAERGPIGFDELHHAARVKPDLSANLVAVLLQAAFCALAFWFAFGRRLGPPRPTLVRQHRSSLEYVESMGALARSAGIERELAGELVARLQRVLELPAAELPVSAEGVRTPADYLALSRRCAELEVDARERG